MLEWGVFKCLPTLGVTESLSPSALKARKKTEVQKRVKWLFSCVELPLSPKEGNKTLLVWLPEN